MLKSTQIEWCASKAAIRCHITAIVLHRPGKEWPPQVTNRHTAQNYGLTTAWHKICF